MWFKNLSGRMGQNLRNLSKLTENTSVPLKRDDY